MSESRAAERGRRRPGRPRGKRSAQQARLSESAEATDGRRRRHRSTLSGSGRVTAPQAMSPRRGTSSEANDAMDVAEEKSEASNIQQTRDTEAEHPTHEVDSEAIDQEVLDLPHNAQVAEDDVQASGENDRQSGLQLAERIRQLEAELHSVRNAFNLSQHAGEEQVVGSDDLTSAGLNELDEEHTSAPVLSSGSSSLGHDTVAAAAPKTSASGSGQLFRSPHGEVDTKQIKTPDDLPKWYEKDNQYQAFDFIELFQMCMISNNIQQVHWPAQLLAAVQNIDHKRWVLKHIVEKAHSAKVIKWESAKTIFIDYFTSADQREELRKL